MEVRTFAESNRAELTAVFARAGAGAPTASLWGHVESEAAIYLTPYMDLEPESLFLAIVDGSIVGYLAGCVDSSTFPTESERIERAIKDYRLVLRRDPAMFFLRSLLDLGIAKLRRQAVAGDFVDPRWPAHLHINVAPEARGTGAADLLMDSWFDRLRAVGSSGCHLQTLVENVRAIKFFSRKGFVAHGPTPFVPAFGKAGGESTS